MVKKLSDRRFYYFKDRYALMLLSYHAGRGKTMREIKSGPFGKLLNRPVVKDLLARLGAGQVSAGDLDSVWPPEPECFHIGFADYGPNKRGRVWFDQTSRPGKNLAVLLNFSNAHDSLFEKLAPERMVDFFRFAGHPHSRDKLTLAWARIDIADDLGEALIEEVQNDWLRNARMYLSWSDRDWKPRHISRVEHARLKRYCRAVLARYGPIWSEALLAAVVKILKQDLEVKNIYYHSFESGILLKDMHGDPPPRSLYTSLPKSFCFRPASEPPLMLAHELERLRLKRGEWKEPTFLRLQW